MHRFLLLLTIFTKIQVGEEVLDVEVADTPSTRAKGLMGRTELVGGMLFVYPEPNILNFWMKNTLIPLSIAFFDEEKVVLNISDMDPPQGKGPLPTYSSDGPAQYALEVPQGWFDEKNIVPGAKFSFLDKIEK